MSDEKSTGEIKAAGRRVWGYSTDPNAERYDGACDSREEAIEEGRAEADGGPVYVLEGVYPDPAEAVPRAYRIIEQMGDHAGDNWDREHTDWPRVSDDAKRELDEFLATWARKHAPVTFWKAVGEPERVEPEETADHG